MPYSKPNESVFNEAAWSESVTDCFYDLQEKATQPNGLDMNMKRALPTQEHIREVLWQAKEQKTLQENIERTMQCVYNLYSLIKYWNSADSKIDTVNALLESLERNVNKIKKFPSIMINGKQPKQYLKVIINSLKKTTQHFPNNSQIKLREHEMLSCVDIVEAKESKEPEEKHNIEGDMLKHSLKPTNMQELALAIRSYNEQNTNHSSTDKEQYDQHINQVHSIINTFIYTQSLTSGNYIEIVELVRSENPDIIKLLLDAFITKLQNNFILQINDKLWGLVKVLNYCGKDILSADKIVSILELFKEPLKIIHTQPHQEKSAMQLLLVVSRVLDIAIKNGVYNLDRTHIQEPTEDALGRFSNLPNYIEKELKLQNETNNAAVLYQANYAEQALSKIPNNETPVAEIFRRLFTLGMAVDEGFSLNFFAAYEKVMLAKRGIFGKLLKIVSPSLWFYDITVARTLLSQNLFEDFDYFIRNDAASLLNDNHRPYFLRGVVNALHDTIATCNDVHIRKRTIKSMCEIATKPSFGCNAEVRQDIGNYLYFYINKHAEETQAVINEYFPSLTTEIPTTTLDVESYAMPFVIEEQSNNDTLFKQSAQGLSTRPALNQTAVAKGAKIGKKATIMQGAVLSLGVDVPVETGRKGVEMSLMLEKGRREQMLVAAHELTKDRDINQIAVESGGEIREEATVAQGILVEGRTRITSSPAPVTNAFTGLRDTKINADDTKESIEEKQRQDKPTQLARNEQCINIIKILNDHCSDTGYREATLEEIESFRLRSARQLSDEDKKILAEILYELKVNFLQNDIGVCDAIPKPIGN